MTWSPSAPMVERARAWLNTHAIPLWLERGFDKRRGYFYEALDADLNPVPGPVRTMVQARQIYAFRTALDLDLCPMECAARRVNDGVRFLLDHCRREDGGYHHAVTPGLGVSDARPDLYAQAFALFGLGNAFALAPLPEYRRRARELVEYLRRERTLAAGGFFEIDAAGARVHQSNPLMHLFEAALYWAENDAADETWPALASELAALARDRLIDPATGLIAEHFDANWRPLSEDGRFFFEPGHQFEWAWLLDRHRAFVGAAADQSTLRLYDLATRHGVHRGRVIDQVWSDLTPRATSARFWPQAERTKAAVIRGDRAAADEALGALTQYLDVPRPGLWCDSFDATGARDQRPSKASSLYHIIGAMAEYMDQPSAALARHDQPGDV